MGKVYGEKTCRICGKSKQKTEFYSQSKNKNLLRSECKKCKIAKTCLRYAEDENWREEKKAYQKAYNKRR
jgi:hypothetical protein